MRHGSSCHCRSSVYFMYYISLLFICYKLNYVSNTVVSVKAADSQLLFVLQRRKDANFVLPERAEIERLATTSSGDIRAAINALQFTCLKGKSRR